MKKKFTCHAAPDAVWGPNLIAVFNDKGEPATAEQLDAVLQTLNRHKKEIDVETSTPIGRLAETSDYFLKLLRERIQRTLFGRKAVLRTDLDAMVNELEHELAAARKGGAE